MDTELARVLAQQTLERIRTDPAADPVDTLTDAFLSVAKLVRSEPVRVTYDDRFPTFRMPGG